MGDLRWLPIAASIGIGLSVASFLFLLASAIDAVPGEDRRYRDAPPLAFRLAWHPVRWVAHYLGPLLPAAQRQRILVKLRLAGLDYALSAEEFVAGRLLLAIAAAAMSSWLLMAFRLAPAAWPGVAAAAGWMFPRIWLRDRIQHRRRETLKALPFYLDVVTLCVEAGLNLTGAFAQAVQKGPPGPLRAEIARVLRDVRAGKPRVDALRGLSDRLREPAITNLVAALIQAENVGMNLGPILRAQSEQRRAERFARAEKLAMEAPVKLLFPLLAFIFPCTFVVLGFPIAMKFIHMGL